MSSGLLGVPGFIGVRPGCFSGSLGSLGCALGDVGIVRSSWIRWGAPRGSSSSFGVAGYIWVGLRVVAFGRFLCVHWDTPGASSGSFGFGGFIGVRPEGRRVRSGSLGSFGWAMGVVGFVRCR